MCVLHIKPFFLPIGIQHNQCPCRFFNPGEMQAPWSQNYATQRYLVVTYAVSEVNNAMPAMSSHWIRYDSHDIHIL